MILIVSFIISPSLSAFMWTLDIVFVILAIIGSNVFLYTFYPTIIFTLNATPIYY